MFTLNFAQVLLVRSAFLAAYTLFSIPAALIVKRFGYMSTATIGLSLMTLGCLLLVLVIGMTTVQVVADPLISLLGKPQTAPGCPVFGYKQPLTRCAAMTDWSHF